MEPKNNITKHSVIAGFLIGAIFPLLIFSDTYFIFLCIEICDFGLFWNPIFWGILFPLFLVFLFSHSAKKLSYSLNQISYFKACSQFSFGVSLRLIQALFAIYIIGIFINGISVALRIQIYDKILFSLLMILFLSFILMILTFLSSLLLIKGNHNPQTLNETK